MKEITKKLREQIVRDLTHFAGQLRNEGFSDIEIGRTLKRHQDCKIKDFYNSQKNKIEGISTNFVEELKEPSADSKAEMVLYNKLKSG